MPQVINFDVLTADTVEVEKTVGGVHRVWKLRDDVSAEVLMRFFELAQAQAGTLPEGDVVAQFRAADRIYLAVLLDIFHHTYAETTEDELRTAFTFEERKRLVDAFFSLAGIGSNAPSNATPAGGQTSTATSSLSAPAEHHAANPSPANRATRRSHKRKTS